MHIFKELNILASQRKQEPWNEIYVLILPACSQKVFNRLVYFILWNTFIFQTENSFRHTSDTESATYSRKKLEL